jgi:septum formation protein
MDKAGSYAIQEWIGFIGISKIEGCYYNVMGLPLHDLRRAIISEFVK